MQKEILLIIPAFNEEDSIERVVETLIKHYPSFDYVVVNDGSRDRTGDICRERGYNYINYPVNIGLAGAFQGGMKYAEKKGYQYAIQYDGDGQHNPEYIAPMLDMAVQERCDIVVGSRYVTEPKPWTLRMLGSRIIGMAIAITTGKRIKDPTSGMRLFNRRMIEILSKQVNFGPEPDTLAFLIRCGAKVKECPVTMRERMAGKSYLNAVTSTKYMIRMFMSIMVVQWFRKKV